MVSVRILASLGLEDKSQLQTLIPSNPKVQTYCERNFPGKRENGLCRIKERGAEAAPSGRSASSVEPVESQIGSWNPVASTGMKVCVRQLCVTQVAVRLHVPLFWLVSFLREVLVGVLTVGKKRWRHRMHCFHVSLIISSISSLVPLSSPWYVFQICVLIPHRCS